MKRPVVRILFVCSGNTCRSPLAEAIARKLLVELGAHDVVVESAGVHAIDGGGASTGALEVARQHGLDLEGFESRRLTSAAVERADLVLVMEPAHRPAVLSLSPLADMRTQLLGQLAGTTGAEAAVPDPFGGSLESYRRTFRRIDEFLRDGMDKILELARSRSESE
jgi:protein-tyrosine-phosphatase